MDNMRLSDVTKEDAPGMTALIASLTEWFSPDEVETVRAVVGPPGVVAAPPSGEIVAFLVWEARPEEWEICWLAVAREWHRQGLGKRMLSWMIERARQAGVKRIRVQTVAHTSDYAPYVPTRAFYEATGFALERIEPDGWPDGLDKAIYVLTLQGGAMPQEPPAAPFGADAGCGATGQQGDRDDRPHHTSSHRSRFRVRCRALA